MQEDSETRAGLISLRKMEAVTQGRARCCAPLTLQVNVKASTAADRPQALMPEARNSHSCPDSQNACKCRWTAEAHSFLSCVQSTDKNISTLHC